MAQEVEQTDIRDISYTEAYANKIIEKSLGEYIRQSEKKQTEKYAVVVSAEQFQGSSTNIGELPNSAFCSPIEGAVSGKV